MTTEDRLALAARITAELFQNGFGDQADRLVLTVDGPPRRDFGGWNRRAVEEVIARLLPTSVR